MTWVGQVRLVWRRGKGEGILSVDFLEKFLQIFWLLSKKNKSTGFTAPQAILVIPLSNQRHVREGTPYR